VRVTAVPSIVTLHSPATISMRSAAPVLKWYEPGRINPRVFFAPFARSTVWLTTLPSK
jgi:hypothetical protein